MYSLMLSLGANKRPFQQVIVVQVQVTTEYTVGVHMLDVWNDLSRRLIETSLKLVVILSCVVPTFNFSADY